MDTAPAAALRGAAELRDPTGRRPREPLVTIAVPMLDERRHIEACLDSFALQDWPLERLEILVIDGGSTDGSREFVDAYAAAAPWVRVVSNPDRRASAAFNLGMREARGDVVGLFSAHGVAANDYVRRSVEALHQSGAAGVGGRYLHVGTDPQSRAIGLAMSSPVGMASPHRHADRFCTVDTISHPLYWRDAMLGVGGFDTSLGRNSDYEFNYRLRRQGHTLAFDPLIESIYRPRPDLTALASQFWHYGLWKAEVLRRHPGSLRVRHLAAPFAVLTAAASVPALAAGGAARKSALFGFGTYMAVVSYGVAKAKPKEHSASVATLAAAFPTMHGAWGAGFVVSALKIAAGRMRRRNP